MKYLIVLAIIFFSVVAIADSEPDDDELKICDCQDGVCICY